MTSAFEVDALVKEIIDKSATLFPAGDFHEATDFYDVGELGLALDAVFFALKKLQREIPFDLYEKIKRASETMGLFDCNYWDAIKPKTR
jgi:hypothetical protein